MSKRARTSAWSLVAILLVGLAAPRLSAQGTAPAAAAAVEVAPVTSKTVAQTRSIAGELLPFESVAIVARVNGYVREVLVDRGSPVRKGQALASLDAAEVVAQRVEAEARLAAVRSQQAAARSTLVGLQNTLSGLKAAATTVGAVSTNELVQAEQAVAAQEAVVAAADAEVRAAIAAVDVVAQQERYLSLTAPFDGVITERSVHPGALVGPQSGATPLFRLEQTRRLRLVVAVPETGLGTTGRGTSVEFTVPAYPGVVFKAPVSRLAGSVDQKTRTMPVELDVTNTDNRLAPGMYPSVRWPVVRAAPSLLVPRTAVVTTTERVFVVRVKGGKAEWVTVTRGVADGDRVEVLGDLQPGDDVVVRGTDELRPGQAVATRRAAAK